MTQTNRFVILDNPGARLYQRPESPDQSRHSDSAGLLHAALALTDTKAPAALPSTRATTHRTVSRRGVIWLGQTCNLHCDFCYFIDRVHSNTHPEHAFMPLEKARKICKILAETYGNTSVDIEGGEPALYPKILELLSYCSGIGLYPTLITNAITLDNAVLCRSMKDAGLRDFKISIHGLGEVHDRLVGRPGAHKRQMNAIRNMREIGIPFRFNTVLTPAVLPQLPDIARLAVETGALCVNWLGYNPHEDQLGKPERQRLIPNFTEMRGPMTEALDILRQAGIESNARYMPACMVEDRHRECIYDYQQLFFDHREWDLASWSWTTLPPQRRSAGPVSDPVSAGSLRWWARTHSIARWSGFVPFFGKLLSIKRMVNNDRILNFLLRAQRLLHRANPDNDDRAALYNRVARLHSKVDCGMEYEKDCGTCAARNICSGVLADYHRVFGTGEIRPISGPLIDDPLRYIGRQRKLVETEDVPWALGTEVGR